MWMTSTSDASWPRVFSRGGGWFWHNHSIVIGLLRFPIPSESFLAVCMFPGIFPFDLGSLIGWGVIVLRVLWQSFSFRKVSSDVPLLFLILVVCLFPFVLDKHLARLTKKSQSAASIGSAVFALRDEDTRRPRLLLCGINLQGNLCLASALCSHPALLLAFCPSGILGPFICPDILYAWTNREFRISFQEDYSSETFFPFCTHS